MVALLCYGKEEIFYPSFLELLRCEGYEVRVTSDAEKSLQILRSERVELLIVDIELAEEDDFYFLKKAKHLHYIYSSVPAIFIASPAHKMQLIKAMVLYEASSFLLKPIDWELLLAMIQAKISAAREQKVMAQSDRTRENYLSFYMLIKEIQESLEHIRLFAEKIIQGNKPVENAKQIKTASKHLINLINNVLKVREQEERQA